MLRSHLLPKIRYFILCFVVRAWSVIEGWRIVVGYGTEYMSGTVQGNSYSSYAFTSLHLCSLLCIHESEAQRWLIGRRGERNFVTACTWETHARPTSTKAPPFPHSLIDYIVLQFIVCVLWVIHSFLPLMWFWTHKINLWTTWVTIIYTVYVWVLWS